MEEFILLLLILVVITLIVYSSFLVITPLGAFFGIIMDAINKYIIHRAPAHKTISDLIINSVELLYSIFRNLIVIGGLILLFTGLIKILAHEFLKGFGFCIGGLILLFLTKKRLKEIGGFKINTRKQTRIKRKNSN